MGALLGIGILFLPYIFAWALLRSGYSARARTISFSWLAIALVIAALMPAEESVVTVDGSEKMAVESIGPEAKAAERTPSDKTNPIFKSAAFRETGEAAGAVENDQTAERDTGATVSSAKKAGATVGASGMTRGRIDQMTTYAVMLGRAVGCGHNTQTEMKRVGMWMDMVAPPGTSDQQIYLPMFMDGVMYHARQQSSGKSPDGCVEVINAYHRFDWP